MDKEKIKNIITEPTSFGNKDLMECMDFLSEKHEETKQVLFDLTYQLDELEKSYNKILDEFKNRKK